LGIAFLRHLLNGEQPRWDASRIAASTDLLFKDLERQTEEVTVFTRNAELNVPGLGIVSAPILLSKQNGEQLVIGLSGPLTPDEPADATLHDLKEYSSIPTRLVDEIAIRRNLPRVASEILAQVS
jgi:hypothetical protein